MSETKEQAHDRRTKEVALCSTTDDEKFWYVEPIDAVALMGDEATKQREMLEPILDTAKKLLGRLNFAEEVFSLRSYAAQLRNLIQEFESQNEGTTNGSEQKRPT